MKQYTYPYGDKTMVEHLIEKWWGCTDGTAQVLIIHGPLWELIVQEVKDAKSDFITWTTVTTDPLARFQEPTVLGMKVVVVEDHLTWNNKYALVRTL